MNAKKLVSLVLALVMVLALSTSAMAATITIDDANVTGASYAAYKLLNATNSADSTTNANTRYAYTVNEKYRDVLIEVLELQTTGTDDEITDEEIIDAIDAVDDADGMGTQAFADAMYAKVKDMDVDATATSNVFSDVDQGYYLIVETATGETPEGVGDDVYSRIMLDTAGLDAVTVNTKEEIPTGTKKILDDANKVDANSVGVGSVVSYQIDTAVPNHASYEKYYFIVNDTLSTGLTFDASSVVVKVGDQTLTAGTDYTLFTGNDAEGYTFQVAFKNIKSYTVGTDITVQYAATVNENAVVDDAGNENTFKLTYSNNPNSDENGDTDDDGKPDEGVPTGESPEDKTLTYIAQLEIFKTQNGAVTPLAGAEFTLTGTSTQTLLTGKTYYVEDANGTYWLLKNGTYTTQDPNGKITNEAGEEVDVDKTTYASTETKYALATTTTVDEVSVPVVKVGTSDANGKITFTGLGEGTYTIEETVVPAGFNKADNVTVVIVCNEPETVATGTETCTWEVGSGSSTGVTVESSTATYKITIQNQSGTELPSTGGMGTTVLYIAGGLLIVAAVIMMATKRRENAAE